MKNEIAEGAMPFAKVLGVDSLRPFAEMLGREPIITNSSIGSENEPTSELPQREQLRLL